MVADSEFVSLRSCLAILTASIALIVLAGCASPQEPSATSATTGTSAAAAAPALTGPRADLSRELRGGKGTYLADTAPPDLSRLGYVQHEYLASGIASSYRAPPRFRETVVGTSYPKGALLTEPE